MSSEINAVYNSVDSVDACLELTNKIKGALYQIAHNFVYIGFLLAECNDYQTYKEWGYNSIYEYALEQFNFKKSSVNNFINVCKTFSSNWSNHGHNLPYSMVLKDGYSDFNYSQLVEMLSMSDKQRSQVTPDMTVKQIREVKKNDIDFEHYFYCNVKHEEFEFSMSKKVEGKKYVLKVAGVLVDPSDVHPEGYFISFDGSLGFDCGFGSFSKPFTVIDDFVDCIYDYFNRYDKSDDSRRLEAAPEEAAAPEPVVIKNADFDLLEPAIGDLCDLFNEIEEASLSASGIDSPLYEIAMEIFQKHNYLIYRKSK